MFQFFRINDPYRLIIVFFLAIVIRVVYFFFDVPPTLYEFKWLLLGERLGDGFTMYKEAFDYTAPLSAFMFKGIDVIFGRSILAHRSIATVFICINAALFNLLLVRNRAYEENNFLPALFYVLICCSLPDFCALSPQLMATTFVLMSLNNVLRRLDNKLGEELFLNAGLYLGLAGLFYLPSFLFFLLFLVAFILFSSAKARRVVLYFYGVLLPFGIMYGFFAWRGSGIYFLQMVFASITESGIGYMQRPEIFLSLGVLAFWFLVGVYGSLFLSRQGNYESRVMQVIFLFTLTAAVILLIDREVSVTQIVFFVPPLSYFVTYYFISIKKFIWKTAMPFLLVGSLIALPYFTKNGVKRADSHPGSELEYDASSAMVLSDNYNVYSGYHIASPFIDPAISKKQVKRLDYYESAVDMYYALSENLPEVIIDDWGIIKPYFEKYPKLKAKYKSIDNRVYRLNN